MKQTQKPKIESFAITPWTFKGMVVWGQGLPIF